ncbi:exonuclease VII large subunit [Inhella inkyongensis]|uniref:Exonuclease VII large subunit n=1 Tax=Inhella inkyongensis TaxID=392593 RepID=A0A840S503_9BURK|nr:hypothetical protein [Inhella inkyongensis]MBB5203711.1 exonuclease VII large subunit [Inhella inkyongensis]
MSARPRSLLDPALWRLEAARRQRQLQELQQHLQTLEAEFEQLRQQIQAFVERYQAQLEADWQHVEALQAALHQALDQLCGEALVRPALRRHSPLPQLPQAVVWPAPPSDDITRVTPSLKDLHRRAAMRLHPDRAQSEADRLVREDRMRAANIAYQDQDRPALEALLLAAGESAARLGGFDVQAQWHWLERCEALAQGRLRVLKAHRVALQQHPMFQLAQAVERAEARGLRPLDIMATRLRAQQRELQQQLYIGARLQPSSALAQHFVAQWRERLGQPALKGACANSSSS